MQRLPLFISVAALSLAAAAPASAGTVEVRDVPREFGSDWELVHAAAPGERNDIAFTFVDDYTLRVSDAGAAITPGARCRAIDANTAECTVRDEPQRAGVPYLVIARSTTGDGDDVVRSIGEGGPILRVDAGPGDDLVEGALLKADVIDGGGGADRLFGRGNNDTLADGDTPGAVDADVLDGGSDGDTVAYSARTAPLRIDLGDEAPDGERGEGDTLRGFEGVIGGAAGDDIDGTAEGDWLRGGGGRDHLDGLGGSDDLEGGAGNDRLHGHAGYDRLDGGTGADVLRGDSGPDLLVAPTRADTLSCGRGLDRLVDAGLRVLIGRSCERLGWQFDGASGDVDGDDGDVSLGVDGFPLRTTPRTVTFSVGCPLPEANDGLCSSDTTQTIRLTAADGRTLGVGRLDRERYRREAEAERGETSRITVRLTATGRSLLGRRGGYRATVTLQTRRLEPVAWRARLRAR